MMVEHWRGAQRRDGDAARRQQGDGPRCDLDRLGAIVAHCVPQSERGSIGVQLDLDRFTDARRGFCGTDQPHALR
jgi:hypothetical protein